MSEAVRTTCPYCGVGCGVVVRKSTSKPDEVTIAGDPAHPANRGSLCSKGRALGETLVTAGRLLAPRVHGKAASWDDALQTVAQGFSRIIRESGPDAVAFYVSGQLLTEDYYVANKLMKGYIGSANIDTNSRLCMASSVAAHKRAFGEDVVPGSYEDLDTAKLIVLVGSNTAWCHPVLYQRIVRAKELNPDVRVVVIDPRRTATCDLADLHLPLRAGTDVWLFNGLLVELARGGKLNQPFVRDHTRDFDRALLVAENTAGDLPAVARLCALSEEKVRTFYDWFANTEQAVTLFSQGVNQSSAGTDKANAIINVHLATGRIGRPGMGPFSLTGQPNAMGGREVGGLSNALAAHLDLENVLHRDAVQKFWGSPRMAERPGLKAVELFEALHAGRVRAVWIMGTNPVVSLPDADRVRAALRRCELVVVSDCIAATDTTALAHVLLPATGWSEKDGTVTNSDRTISRQRAFRAPAGEARADWAIVSELAQRMGFGAAFSYRTPAEIFAEHAALSEVASALGRAFDLGGLADLLPHEYESLPPTQWPIGRQHSTGTKRVFEAGGFSTPDGRARIVPTAARAPVHAPSDEYPLVLNSGRIRDQWHTMTRTGFAPSLTAHVPEPYVDLHPEDALLWGIKPGELARVTTAWGTVVLRARASGECRRGSAFVPMHWNDQFASDARIGALMSPAVDPISGEPEFKYTPVRVEPFRVSWHGFALARQPIALDSACWWVKSRGRGHERYELAGRQVPGSWADSCRAMLKATQERGEWLEYLDEDAGVYRAALLVEGQLDACVFISGNPDLPAGSWLAGLFAESQISLEQRRAILRGAPRGTAGRGDLICSCYQVGSGELMRAISAGCQDVSALSAKTKAGTGCGSCVPELRRLVQTALRANESLAAAHA